MTPRCVASFQGTHFHFLKKIPKCKIFKKRKIRLPINRLITMEEELRREQLKVMVRSKVNDRTSCGFLKFQV